jgi:Ca2+-transporting ATPase
VFSRVIPENKYRLLELLKKQHITAMTGDGVNDVPALTNANIGVAMGSGSQIAKDAGDIILLDNNFKSIVDAMREGRTIIANIRRMLFYLLSTNGGEALIAIGALAIGLPIPMVPVQILWVNLVTDTLMVIPLGLEPGQKDTMKRRPKTPKAPILSHFMSGRIILVAITMAVTALSIYAFFMSLYGEAYARTIAFSAIVVMQWANAFNARSDYQSLIGRLRAWNTPFYIGLFIAIVLQFMALFGPLQPILHITPVAIGDLFVTGLIAFIVPIVVVEIHKYIGRRFHKSSNVI